MTTEAALLAAIAANPDDDMPRLVYAEWLDENDRPLRAEFIRLQIEIAKKETLPRAAVNTFAYLWQRQQEILDGHMTELLGEVGGPLRFNRIEFRRGFPSELHFRHDGFILSGETVSKLIPLPERVVLNSEGRYTLEICAPGVSGLDVVTDLSISGTRSEANLAIRDCSGWLRLQSLDLTSCYIGNAGILELSRPPSFPALVDLDLSFNDLTDAGVIDLLNTGLPQRLKRLVLGGNPIGDQAAMELADRLGRSTVLETLNLRMTNIGRAGQAAITRAFGSRADLF